MSPTRPPVRPTRDGEREPILDVLRGSALLGILLVNISLMRGADIYAVLSGNPPRPGDGLDRLVDGAVSWLAAGKFVSSFSLLFGVGAGLIVERAQAAGVSARSLLARRYAWLLLFGLAHMILLFPGDILFVYGIVGMVLLVFADVRPSTALWWGGGLIGGVTALGVGFAGLTAAVSDTGATVTGDDALTRTFESFFARRGEQAVAAFTDGSYLDVVVANAWQSLLIQSGQLLVLPWLLGLFLVGFAVSRSGVALHLREHRPLLRRAAAVGLGLGLPLNVVLGLVDPLDLIAGAAGRSLGPALLLLIPVAQQAGAPLLAVGYLAGLSLLSLRWSPPRPLAAIGRMALTGYLLQSSLALVVFGGLGLYDHLSSSQSMLIVLGIWGVLFLVCPLWLRFFRFGPAEWLWRSLTYGAREPLRR